MSRKIYEIAVLIFRLSTLWQFLMAWLWGAFVLLMASHMMIMEYDDIDLISMLNAAWIMGLVNATIFMAFCILIPKKLWTTIVEKGYWAVLIFLLYLINVLLFWNFVSELDRFTSNDLLSNLVNAFIYTLFALPMVLIITLKK